MILLLSTSIGPVPLLFGAPNIPTFDANAGADNAKTIAINK
jgi:hypothetical protein